jgi:hypothetical protein
MGKGEAGHLLLSAKTLVVSELLLELLFGIVVSKYLLYFYSLRLTVEDFADSQPSFSLEEARRLSILQVNSAPNDAFRNDSKLPFCKYVPICTDTKSKPEC